MHYLAVNVTVDPGVYSLECPPRNVAANITGEASHTHTHTHTHTTTLGATTRHLVRRT